MGLQLSIFRFSSVFLSFIGVVFVASSMLGCGAVPQTTLDPTKFASSASPPVTQLNSMLASAAISDSPVLVEDYRLGPEDMVQITLFNVAGGDGGGLTPREVSLRVSQQGNVTLPLLGELQVAGLTVRGLEKALRDRYEKYVYNPEVGVLVREFRSQRVSLIGSVNRAGVIDLTGPKTLIDVLAMAGGVSQRAGNQVHVYRQSAEGRKSYVIDLFALASSVGLINAKTAGVEVLNIQVQAGDIINVPEAGNFYVDGAVRRAGAFALGRRYTITQAIVLAGGLDLDTSDFGNITLYRTVNGDVQQISINLNAIRDGKEPDLALQADDFLFVPISGIKWAWNFFIKNVGLPSPYPYVMP